MIRDRPRVSVIVPTLGLPERADLLEQALASVERQAAVEAVAIVVLNGRRACPDVERTLRRRLGPRLIRLTKGDLPAALASGRQEVRTPYFTALDDDDLLLPGALAARVAALEADPDLDLVVTDGFRDDGGRESLNIGSRVDVARDPLRALVRRNWLLPGSWLCRTARVGSDLFDGMPRYLECTFLAARFATEYRLGWVPVPTVAYRLDSPHAESRSSGYLAGQAEALRGILALDLPADVRRVFERRIADAHHVASSTAWRAGRLREAWRWHLATLRSPGGLRYLTYSRHLFRRGGRKRGAGEGDS